MIAERREMLWLRLAALAGRLLRSRRPAPGQRGRTRIFDEALSGHLRRDIGL
jgi:hypothetical protein